VTGRMLELRANLAQNIRDRPCGARRRWQPSHGHMQQIAQK
jgi:hypothetical protein